MSLRLLTTPAAAFCAAALLFASPAIAQKPTLNDAARAAQTASAAAPSPKVTPAPRIVSKDGRHMLLVDGEPYLILGAQMHNSSNWPTLLPKVWEAVDELGANTLEAPIYWEQMEPQPGKFDFSAVDRLLATARAHNKRLVLLWFGTWKNGSGHY